MRGLLSGGDGLMIVRRLTLTALVSSCALACVLVAGVALSVAAPLFGHSGYEAGQIGASVGMAIDRERGEVYVGDAYNNRVDEFEQGGSFARAWGWGVINEASEFQVCTAATGCTRGKDGAGAGQFSNFSGAMGVAVDNDPLSSSHGDVYVVDFSNFRVQKFDGSGRFLLMFGGHVNKNGGNVCVAGEECQGGTRGEADGEFKWLYNQAYIGVGPGGAVYVGDRARVQVFEPSGVWRENISLSALSSEGKVTALAVNFAGDVFVKDEGVPGVREFEPGGIEMATRFDQGSEAVEAIALDAAGDVFVSENKANFGEPCSCRFLKYSPSGEELAVFDARPLTFLAPSMVFDDALGELFVYGGDGSQTGFGVWAFAVPPAGPVVVSGSEKATPGLRGTATVEASVNPEGSETTYRFEYVDGAQYEANGFAGASSTPATSIGSSFDDQPAGVELKGLVPGDTYHYRVVATSSQGTARGPDQAFATIPPALIEGPWASSVASTSATLSARIDPLGASTSYRLEYGMSTSYGRVLLSGNAGEGMGYVSIGSYHLQELQPGTTYHYRVVTSSEVGTVDGPDQAFTTQLAGGNELTLLDGRAWELASPPNKSGAFIDPRFWVADLGIQAASNGGAIAYLASEPLGEHKAGNGGIGSQVLSVRGPDGWHSTDLAIPMAKWGSEAPPEYRLFSPDLSIALVEPPSQILAGEPLSPEATERTPYLRDNANGTFLPLVTQANVPAGTKFGFRETGSVYGLAPNENTELMVLAATPDLRHVFMRSSLALTPEAIDGSCPYSGCVELFNLYEWGGGRLQLVNVLPDGTPARQGMLGVSNEVETAHAVSSDGHRVVWQTEGGVAEGKSDPTSLYVRDMVEKKTVRIGGTHPFFQTMSSDGSKVFFLEKYGVYGNGDLYEFDWNTGTTIDLTPHHGAGEENAGVQYSVLGTNEDGSYVYFVATGVLAKGAVGGQYNLYVAHEGGGGWTTRYIATLSGEDQQNWHPYSNKANAGVYFSEFNRVSSRVSPDGRYVAFMSNRALTGYDNRDAVSGQPDEEVYLYDAASGRLVCASCDPTGARPVGVHGPGNQALLMEADGMWESTWLAGSIPGWHYATASYPAFYQPRDLSDSGRLFFDSPDALVPQDTNGLADPYEYELAGVGDCTSASATYSKRSGGCVNLVSSGTSSGESLFYDASENGDDVFFITASRLVSEDYDTAYDVYDAHVCSTAVPCRAAPVSPPPCTSGDSCKAAPSPQPEIFGPAPSATFSGAGNVVVSPSKPVVSARSLTRAKLARALRACRKKTGKKQRTVCERQARKRYPAKQSGKAKATKGNR
jgi:hypothetical protein